MSGFDLSESYGDMSPAVRAAMKDRAAQVFDLAAVPHEAAPVVSLTSVGAVPPDRRDLPKWALPVALLALAGGAYYLTKGKTRK